MQSQNTKSVTGSGVIADTAVPPNYTISCTFPEIYTWEETVTQVIFLKGKKIWNCSKIIIKIFIWGILEEYTYSKNESKYISEHCHYS